MTVFFIAEFLYDFCTNFVRKKIVQNFGIDLNAYLLNQALQGFKYIVFGLSEVKEKTTIYERKGTRKLWLSGGGLPQFLPLSFGEIFCRRPQE